MKSEVSLLCVVVSLVLLLLMVADASCGQPKALMPETTWDFGKVPQGSVVSHSYQIKNIGTDTLKIIKVKPE
jgi:hypothetical protein